MNSTKKRLAYIEGWGSAVLNTGLFAVKIWFGLAIGSVAMVADAWHTLSDTLTSLVVVLGFWVAGRPKDREHPFGHGRAELVGCVIVGTVLVVVGLRFLAASYSRLVDRQSVQFGAAAIIVFACSALVKEGSAQFALRAGKRVGSKILVADGWHHRSDAVASALIVVGALVGQRLWWVDGALGILVSLLILYAAYDVLREAWTSLMGESADADLERTIRGAVNSTAPNATDTHHIHVHRYGDHVEVTLHLELPESLSLKDSHDAVTRVERVLRDVLDIEPTIHFEPARKTLPHP